LPRKHSLIPARPTSCYVVDRSSHGGRCVHPPFRLEILGADPPALDSRSRFFGGDSAGGLCSIFVVLARIMALPEF